MHFYILYYFYFVISLNFRIENVLKLIEYFRTSELNIW